MRPSHLINILRVAYKALQDLHFRLTALTASITALPPLLLSSHVGLSGLPQMCQAFSHLRTFVLSVPPTQNALPTVILHFLQVFASVNFQVIFSLPRATACS